MALLIKSWQAVKYGAKLGLTASRAVKIGAKQFRICPLKRAFASAGWVAPKNS